MCVCCSGTKRSRTSKSQLPVRAQARHPPRVVDHDIAALEIATQRRLVLAVGAFRAREAHEVRRVMSAASERPAAGDAIATFRLLRRTDSTGRARDECARIGEKFPRDRLWQVAADAAHASAIADKPSDRTVERGRGLHDGHEIGWRQLRTAECLRQPQAEETGVRQRVEHGIRQPAFAVERRAMLGDQRREPLDRFEIVRDPVGSFRQHCVTMPVRRLPTLGCSAPRRQARIIHVQMN